jgi:tetratricopeptide (TPR) repeat protein
MGFLQSLEKWIEIFYRIAVILFLAAFLVLLLLSLMGLHRKKILFRAWINRYDGEDKEFGKSIGDLLLFDLQTIKIIHDRSARVLSLWNPNEDIPSFKQGLEQDVELIASVELGNYGKIINSLASFFLKVVPFIIKPALLNGSINKYGEKKILLMVTLDNYRMKRGVSLQKKSKNNTLVWKIEKENLKKEQIPELLEEIAYRIYIDLTGNDLFKSWECFRAYTKGMQKYISYTELQKDNYFDEATKLYNEALDLEPNNPVVCYNKGIMKYYKYEDKENTEAVELFKKALNSSDIQLQARARTGLTNGLVMQYDRFNKKKITLLEEV